MYVSFFFFNLFIYFFLLCCFWWCFSFLLCVFFLFLCLDFFGVRRSSLSLVLCPIVHMQEKSREETADRNETYNIFTRVWITWGPSFMTPNFRRDNSEIQWGQNDQLNISCYLLLSHTASGWDLKRWNKVRSCLVLLWLSGQRFDAVLQSAVQV